MLELTPIFILATIFIFIYALVHLSVRRKERMALLAKGADPSVFHDEVRNKITTLKYGLFLIGIGIGILIGRILVSAADFEPEVAYFSMVFLWGGIALVISYFLARKIEKDEEIR
jgi:hypothetical protein